MKSFLKKILIPELPEDIGDVLVSWQVPEYTKYERDKKWYVLALLFITGLLIFCVFSYNFLFAIIILLFTFIGVMQHYQNPNMIDIQVTDLGVAIGNRFYAYKDLKSFWIVYNPAIVKTLNIDFANSFRSYLTVQLNKVNPLIVRDTLEQFLIEDLEKEGETFEEKLSRVIKF